MAGLPILISRDAPDGLPLAITRLITRLITLPERGRHA
jgi:hypothetical protein